MKYDFSLKLKERCLLILKGFCIGAADVVPGVSGGTMAFILGIYAELIAAIKSFDLAWLASLVKLDFNLAISRPHFGFLLPLSCGIVAALLFFVRIVELPQLLVEYPQEIYGLFFGLIAGSIVTLLMELKALTIKEAILLLTGIVSGLIVFNLTPGQTPDDSWFIFIAGALAICAMILPGISGSFVLLILNKYTYVFNAIGYFKFSVLIPFALGAVTGIVLFSRLLSYVLKHYYRLTMLFITGILVASLSVIWPFQESIRKTAGGNPGLIDTDPMAQSVLVSVSLIIAGFAVVLGIRAIGNRQQATGNR